MAVNGITIGASFTGTLILLLPFVLHSNYLYILLTPTIIV